MQQGRSNVLALLETAAAAAFNPAADDAVFEDPFAAESSGRKNSKAAIKEKTEASKRKSAPKYKKHPGAPKRFRRCVMEYKQERGCRMLATLSCIGIW